MSDSPTASPVVLGRWEKPGNLASIAALAAAGQVTILPHELIRTTDGRVYHWTGTALEITSAPVHHGTVADVAALDGIYLLPTCTRGVHQGDTAYVTSAACEYRVASGVNATATWAACAAIPTSASAIGADPSGTAATAVSAHNTAPDSHADIRTLIARNADHAALSNVLPSTASQNHLTDDELEFFGTLPSTISDLMSNVEEVDADFVSISYNPSGGGGVTVPDPIREYALTADFSDSMGGSALTPTNAVITDGWAVLTAGYLTIPDDVDLDLTEWTIAVDVQQTGTTTWQRIFDLGSSTTNFVTLTLLGGGNQIRLKSLIGTAEVTGESTSMRLSTVAGTASNWPIGTTQTVVVARSATEAKVFIGGRLVYSVPGLPALSEITRTLSYFGRSQYSADPYFTGRMRNARIWGVCLSPAQVVSVSI